MVIKMEGYFDGYDNWSKLGMIIYHDFNGNSEGLELFDDLSKLFKNYKDKHDVTKYYMNIKPTNKKNKLTISSLYKMYYEKFPEDKVKGIYGHPSYIEGKEQLEKRVFKLNNPVSFVILEQDNEMQIID